MLDKNKKCCLTSSLQITCPSIFSLALSAMFESHSQPSIDVDSQETPVSTPVQLNQPTAKPVWCEYASLHHDIYQRTTIS